MYTGKEICQGCKKTGEENPRASKTNLCSHCEDALSKGLAQVFEEQTEYVTVKDWVNGFASIDFDDSLLDSLANDLFRSLHNEHVDRQYGNMIQSPRSQIHGGVYYNIPKKVSDSLIVFLTGLNKEIQSIRKEKEKIGKMAQSAVKNERDRIYNEGISKGRELLMQLNSGQITMKDFEATYKYNKS